MPGRREGWAEGWVGKAQEVVERIMGGGVLWQGELGCGEGKRTEDGRVWQEVKLVRRVSKDRCVCWEL